VVFKWGGLGIAMVKKAKYWPRALNGGLPFGRYHWTNCREEAWKEIMSDVDDGDHGRKGEEGRVQQGLAEE